MQVANVVVHPQGGWVTMVDLAEGRNVVTAGTATGSFKVAYRRRPESGAAEFDGWANFQPTVRRNLV